MRTVVRSVLQNGQGPVVDAAEDRRALRTTMESAIREVEASGEKGMELDVAAAWRRVGAARLEEGNTDGGVEALQKAHDLAERVWTAKKDPAALESKAVSLPLLALALQARRDSDESMTVAKRAIALQGEYRRVFGRPLGPANPYYRLILQMGPARARRGEAEAGRRLLLEALGVAREVKSSEYTGRALVGLAELEKIAGREGEAKGYCEEAGRVAPLVRRLREVCGSGAAGTMSEDEQIATMRAQIRAKVEEIRRDPERFQAVRRLAGMHQQLGQLLHERGRDGEARVELERAAGYLEELVKKDPRSIPLQKQARRTRLQLEQLSK
jgi:tetratricopeptide (TPR) repeat protein